MNPSTLNTSDFERGLIAAVILDPTKFHEATVSGQHFFDPGLGGLFDAVRVLHDAGTPVSDMKSLVPAIRKMSLDPELTNGTFLGELFNETFHVASAVYYAEQIHRAWSIRRLSVVLKQAAGKLEENNADPEATARWLETQLTTEDLPQAHRPELALDVYGRVVAELSQPKPPEGHGVMAGLECHDELLGGWQAGELIILAARPGAGKTSLAQQIAWHQGTRGRTAAFVSLEMSSEELVQRMISSVTGIDSTLMRRRDIDARDLRRIRGIHPNFEQSGITIWDPARATSADIRSFAKRQAAQGPLHLLVVDYIGLVRPMDSRRPRHEQVSEVTASLKSLAKELRIPVLCLSQLNREADGQTPRLAHLRESGAIEQDADVVLFLHQEDKKITKLIVAKNRHGGTGSFDLAFDPIRTTFREYEPPAADCKTYDNRLNAFSGGANHEEF